MVLTSKQKEELNLAILEYLYKNNYQDTAIQFEEESRVSLDSSTKNQMSDILEKKWVSILRLQKKVMEYEQKLDQLTEELQSKNSQNFQKNNIDQEMLFPKHPSKHNLSGHRSVVTCIAFHPQFSQIASSSEDASIRLWDFETGQYEKSLKGHTSTVNYISYEQQGKYLASASSDLTLKIWDLDALVCLRTLHGHDHSVSCVEFLPNGDFLLSASRDKTIKLWDSNTGFCKRTYTGHDDWVRRLAINNKGNLMASGSSDQSIMLWTIEKETPKLVLNGHEHVIECILFINNDNGKKAIGESIYAKKEMIQFARKTTIEEQKVDQLQKIFNDQHNKDLLNNAVNKNYNQFLHCDFLISGSRDKSIKIWNCQNGNCLINLIGHDNWVRGLALHHSGKFLYSCSDDKSIRIWDLNLGKCNKKIQDAHNHFVGCIASSEKYLVIASGGVDNLVKVWECK